MMRTFFLAVSVLLLLTPARADMKAGLEAAEKRDFTKAAQLLEDAFKNGEVDAAFYMGRLLESGAMGQPELQAAVALYVAGASRGSALAKNRLGLLHLEGLGVLQDFQKGANLICDAAKSGEPNAEFNCGSVHEQGKGVSKDTKKAYEWYAKAATKEHIAARNVMALAYEEGKEVGKDVSKASKLWQQNAAAGNPLALYKLGLAFENGHGVEKSLTKAHAYYNLAASRQMVEGLEARKRIEATMTPQQVTEAQQIARAWRPQPEGKK